MIINGETACCYSYNACNELTDELGDQGEVDYAYDGRGNCILKAIEGGTATYFEYNARNLITRIDSTEPGFTPNVFTYNALGQRISKADSTGTTYYVWDGPIACFPSGCHVCPPHSAHTRQTSRRSRALVGIRFTESNAPPPSSADPSAARGLPWLSRGPEGWRSVRGGRRDGRLARPTWPPGR